MIRVNEVILVEGRYDKNTLSQFIDGTIIESSGFGIFSDKEKLNLLRRLAEKSGLVVLTDSDGAGFVIRNYIKGSIDPKYVKHAYIPDIIGKERRKKTPSKEGKLGVEGMSREVIEKALACAGVQLGDKIVNNSREKIIKSDLYEYGLSGTAGSSEKRRKLLAELQLPEKLSPNALIDVLNALMTKNEFIELLERDGQD